MPAALRAAQQQGRNEEPVDLVRAFNNAVDAGVPVSAGSRKLLGVAITAMKTSGMAHRLYSARAAGYCCGVMLVPLAKIQLRRDEDGVWIAKSSLLPGCHAHGRDRGEAALRFQQAAKAHLEALLETGRPIPPALQVT